MRSALFLMAAGAAAILEPAAARALLAGGASVLLECLPYLAAAGLLRAVLGSRLPGALAFAGCGCARGPSARSIPAAVAAALLFGPLVALGRVACACAVARIFESDPAAHHGDTRGFSSVASEVQALAPTAFIAAGISALLPQLTVHLRSPLGAAGIGVLLGLFATPCALGNVAIAAALRTQLPLASAAYLCIAGIADAGVWLRRNTACARHDAFAYLLLAIASALGSRSSGLVHPHVAIALAPAAVLFIFAAWKYRREHHAQLRWTPALLLCALVTGAPAPVYTATETTLSGAFPGERLDFTGVTVPSQDGIALVRYAITCCRADAQPVAIALASTHALAPHRWARARGVVVRRGDELVLDATAVDLISPPSDPFVYR
jgi:hypothetical protein